MRTSELVAELLGAPVTASSLPPVPVRVALPPKVLLPETASDPRVPTPVMLVAFRLLVRSLLVISDVERLPDASL